MMAVAINVGLVLAFGLGTGLLVWAIHRRWAMREERFAVLSEQILAARDTKPGLACAGDLPPWDATHLRAIAETATPGLDRAEAQLNATANNPAAIEEQPASEPALVVTVSLLDRPESLHPLPTEFAELFQYIREAEADCGGSGLYLRKVELIGGNEAVLRLEPIQPRGAKERLGKLAEFLSVADLGARPGLHRAREKYTKILAVVA